MNEELLAFRLISSKDVSDLSTEDLEKLDGKFYTLGGENWCDTRLHSYKETVTDRWELIN